MSDHEKALEILDKSVDPSVGGYGDYVLARIAVALERIADAQETIAAAPFESAPTNTYNAARELAGLAAGDPDPFEDHPDW